MPRRASRRHFVRTSLAAAGALACPWPGARPAAAARTTAPGRPLAPDPRSGWRGASSAAMQLRAERGPTPPAPDLPVPDLLPPPATASATLAERFPDLSRHFVFEYYPWYDRESYRHWDQWDRVPPDDIASNYVPRLGAYDSLDRAVLDRHARWIQESGVGAVNLSWWGPGSWEDRAVPRVMDAMADHGIKVTFHLEPYEDRRAQRFAEDVLYLIREYGDRRRWDAFLLLRDEHGHEGPLFKGFRCILPAEYTDCHGAVRRVRDFTPDDEWSRQTDGLRHALRHDFHHVTLLADSLEFRRTPASGFDGIAIYDPFVPPEDYAGYAAGASAAGLVFSFSVNAGFDGIDPRAEADRGECYEPVPFAPPTPGLDWTSPDAPERAAEKSLERVAESLEATLAVQTDPRLANVRRGFFLAYLTSFNEWHEGTAFEPMKGAAELTAAERVFPYHNPEQGDHRLAALARRVRDVLRPTSLAPDRRA